MTTWRGLHAAERAQRAELAEQLLAGRRTLDVAALGAVPEDGDHEAIVCLDEVGDVEDLAVVLAAQARRGVAVVAAVRGAHADVMAAALPDATVVHQTGVEVAWLHDAGTSRLTVDVGQAPAFAVRWAIFVANVDAAVDVAGVAAPAGGPVHTHLLEQLQRRNDELQRANARLSSKQQVRESAAAAHVLSQVPELQKRVAALEAELVERDAAHAERLAMEMEVAARNDEMFQEARRLFYERQALLDTPRHRAVESARRRVGRVPLLRGTVRVVWRVVRRAGR